jgi:hypothetical protein
MSLSNDSDWKYGSSETCGLDYKRNHVSNNYYYMGRDNEAKLYKGLIL